MLLWSENETTTDLSAGLGKINKYQRISSIVAAVLEQYAKLSKKNYNPDLKEAKITAVWSPAGGVGKTSVAIAYALSNARDNKKVFYLNLEYFSSSPEYFRESGKSISSVFEMLENQEGDLKMLIQGISCFENGIAYLCSPDNYDDLCILSSENIHELVTACAALSDELVIDLSCVCDARVNKIFERADSVLLVMGKTTTGEVKLAQFMSQNDVFESIKEKVTLVVNKGADYSSPLIESMISLPHVQSSDVKTVCKALSESEQWASVGSGRSGYDGAI